MREPRRRLAPRLPRISASASASARQLGASPWKIHDVARERRARPREGSGVAAGREHGGRMEFNQVRISLSLLLIGVGWNRHQFRGLLVLLFR